MKIRVHELAKKYDKGNKEFIAILHEIGLDNITSHLAGVSDEDVTTIENYFSNHENISHLSSQNDDSDLSDDTINEDVIIKEKTKEKAKKAAPKKKADNSNEESEDTDSTKKGHKKKKG
ncbi:MAG: translation initiation factor IF-2 N-terminal domain-containing protein, partial [Fusobacteriaceae bacterium]